MESIFNIVLFVAIGAFIVFIYLKFGNKSSGTLAKKGASGSSAGGYKSQMPELAAFLGLAHQDIAPPADNKTFLNTGDKIYGKYRDVETEIVMSAFARESDHTSLTVIYSYNFSSTKYFAFKVNNAGNKSFSILPSNKNLVSNPTGVESFDSCLSYTGDLIVPKS
ncbi:MAG: hypothetical protein NTV87_06330, partial [Ignavibacteriae bacterium]|nr:hypothetical protein [Ignavibacteriota bacterium]